MKTGIIRRIDNLGRIVIPKNIRKNMKIKTGDSVEIMEDEETIFLKKYSELENIESIGKIIAEVLKDQTSGEIYITTLDKIIISSKKIQTPNLSNNITSLIEKRQITIIKNKDNNIIISPIISTGDLYGSLIVKCKVEIKNIEIIKIMTKIISKYLEE